jgi:predicted O-methyltransferase YrrM
MAEFVINEYGVHSEDLSALQPYVAFHENAKYIRNDSRGEHYKLLSHIAKQCPPGSRVLDIGTYLGYSALALSLNPGIRVVSYDIQDCLPKDAPCARDVCNISLHIRDCREDFLVPGFLDDVAVILLDVDPHDGVQEKQIVTALVEAGYAGIVICDDVHLNDGMRGFWAWVGDLGVKRVDLTSVGHWSGTGAIVMHAPTVDINFLPVVVGKHGGCRVLT